MTPSYAYVILISRLMRAYLCTDFVSVVSVAVRMHPNFRVAECVLMFVLNFTDSWDLAGLGEDVV